MYICTQGSADERTTEDEDDADDNDDTGSTSPEVSTLLVLLIHTGSTLGSHKPGSARSLVLGQLVSVSPSGLLRCLGAFCCLSVLVVWNVVGRF